MICVGPLLTAFPMYLCVADHETIAALQVQLTATVRRLDGGEDRSACKALLKDFAVRAQLVLTSSSLSLFHLSLRARPSTSLTL